MRDNPALRASEEERVLPKHAAVEAGPSKIYKYGMDRSALPGSHESSIGMEHELVEENINEGREGRQCCDIVRIRTQAGPGHLSRKGASRRTSKEECKGCQGPMLGLKALDERHRGAKIQQCTYDPTVYEWVSIGTMCFGMARCGQLFTHSPLPSNKMLTGGKAYQRKC